MTNEKIEILKGSLDSILQAVRQRNYHNVSEIINNIKKGLEELDSSEELEIYRGFYETIKRKIRNSGRTNVISISEVDEEIIKIGNKISKLEKEDEEKE